jgi:hypothetical protein
MDKRELLDHDFHEGVGGGEGGGLGLGYHHRLVAGQDEAENGVADARAGVDEEKVDRRLDVVELLEELLPLRLGEIGKLRDAGAGGNDPKPVRPVHHDVAHALVPRDDVAEVVLGRLPHQHGEVGEAEVSVEEGDPLPVPGEQQPGVEHEIRLAHSPLAAREGDGPATLAGGRERLIQRGVEGHEVCAP